MTFEFEEFTHDEWSHDSRPDRLLVRFYLEVMLRIENDTWHGRARKHPQTHSWRQGGRYGLICDGEGALVEKGKALLTELASFYPDASFAPQSRFRASWMAHTKEGEYFRGQPWNSGAGATGHLDHTTSAFSMSSLCFSGRPDSRTSYPDLAPFAQALASRNAEEVPLLTAAQAISRFLPGVLSRISAAIREGNFSVPDPTQCAVSMTDAERKAIWSALREKGYEVEVGSERVEVKW